MATSTTVAKFREKLSNWLDSASKGVVFINRGEERFALMNERTYSELNQKISDLQSSLIALMDVKNIDESAQKSDILSKLEKYKRKQA